MAIAASTPVNSRSKAGVPELAPRLDHRREKTAVVVAREVEAFVHARLALRVQEWALDACLQARAADTCVWERRARKYVSLRQFTYLIPQERPDGISDQRAHHLGRAEGSETARSYVLGPIMGDLDPPPPHATNQPPNHIPTPQPGAESQGA
jgi:hypothetical protein